VIVVALADGRIPTTECGLPRLSVAEAVEAADLSVPAVFCTDISIVLPALTAKLPVIVQLVVFGPAVVIKHVVA